MNWGKWIFIVIVLFMMGTLTMVYIAMNQYNPLVTENYYQQELLYDQKLESMNNHNRNSHLISINHSHQFLLFSTEHDLDVKLHLYRPSDDRLDQHFAFQLVDTLVAIDLSTAKKGYYIAKVSYRIDDTQYYTEKELMVK